MESPELDRQGSCPQGCEDHRHDHKMCGRALEAPCDIAEVAEADRTPVPPCQMEEIQQVAECPRMISIEVMPDHLR